MTVPRHAPSADSCRQDPASIRKVFQQVKELPNVKAVCDTLPHIVLILNSNRQIVFANKKLIEFADLKMTEACLGLRPGELFHCINAEAGSGGCGTSERCRVCGALKTILESQQSTQSAVRELRLTVRVNEEAVAFDFKISAAPFSFDQHPLTMVHLIDISDEKRRRVLERIFFHDILNTAGSLLNLSQLMTTTQGGRNDQRATLMHMASKQLIDEIKAQRELMEAENGELDVHFTEVHALECLMQTLHLFDEYRQIQKIDLILSAESCDIAHNSDQTLLVRVLRNMVKNALEASAAGQTVTVGCRKKERTIEYWIHNQGFMPQDVQLQIFQRSFSTKGAGRGLGTYSIRLLTEKFLKGDVSFESTVETGTCFKVEYPLSS